MQYFGAYTNNNHNDSERKYAVIEESQMLTDDPSTLFVILIIRLPLSIRQIGFYVECRDMVIDDRQSSWGDDLINGYHGLTSQHGEGANGEKYDCAQNCQLNRYSHMCQYCFWSDCASVAAALNSR